MRVVIVIALVVGLLNLYGVHNAHQKLHKPFPTNTVTGTVSKITYGETTICYHLEEYPDWMFVSRVSDEYLETSEELTGIDPWALSVPCKIEYLLEDDEGYYEIVNLWRDGKSLIMEDALRTKIRGDGKSYMIGASLGLLCAIILGLIKASHSAKLNRIRKEVTVAFSVGEYGAGKWKEHELRVKFIDIKHEFMNDLRARDCAYTSKNS